MGQQSNKIQKRRRREAYLDRKHEAAKAVVKPKPKTRAARKVATTPDSAPAA